MLSIKRPMVVAAIISIIISIILLNTDSLLTIPIIAILLCLIITSIAYRQLYEYIIIFIVALLVALSFAAKLYTKIIPAEDVNELKTKITATVTDAVFVDDYIRYTVKVTECADDRIVGSSVYLYNYETSAAEGDKIIADVKISTLKNKGRFSHYSKDILFSGSITKIHIIGKNYSALTPITNLRVAIKNTIFSNLPYDIATTINGMTVGDRSYEEQYFSEIVKKCGVSHVMVVSGSHMVIVCGSVYKLTSKLKFPKNISALLTILVTALFMALCGFSPSVLRAGFMYIFMLTGILFRKDTDPLNSLSIVTVVLLIANPFVLYDIGFILSAASTAGIIVLNPLFLRLMKADKWKFRPLKTIAELILLTVSAQIATLPICIYFFGFVSPYAVLANLLISFAVTLAVVSAFVGILMYASPFTQPYCTYVFSLCSFVTSYFNNVILLFA